MDGNRPGQGRRPNKLMKFLRLSLLGIVVLAISIACIQSAPAPDPKTWNVDALEKVVLETAAGTATRTPFLPPTSSPDQPFLTPTPDQARILPTPRQESEQYVVQGGDSLGTIAQRYSVSLNFLIEANELINPDLLTPGQVLNIPAVEPVEQGPDFKIIPDSELVYGPGQCVR